MCDRKAALRRLRQPADEAGFYLEPNGKTVERRLDDRSVLEEGYEIVRCACRCRFCPRCGQHLGIRLRRRVLSSGHALHWKNAFMLTFTIDPQHFESPEQAYDVSRKARWVGETLRKLRREGWIQDGHYFAVIEFQRNGWPHWHVLVKGRRLPKREFMRFFHALKDSWNANGRRCGKDVDNSRAGLGGVDIKLFEDPDHAINYATKYVIKNPREGWPAWVMDSRRNVSRYSTSRGFFDAFDVEGETGSPQPDPDDQDDNEPNQRNTIRERIAKCGVRGCIMRWRKIVVGKTICHEREFIGPIKHLTRTEAVNAVGGDIEVSAVPCPVLLVRALLGQKYEGDEDESSRKANREWSSPREPQDA